MCSAAVLRRVARTAGEQASPAVASDPVPVAAYALPGAPPPLPAADGAPAMDASGVLPYASGGMRRRAKEPRGVSDNPILWREVRRPLMARRWQAVTGTVATLLVLVISYAALGSENALDDNETQIGYAVIFHGL